MPHNSTSPDPVINSTCLELKMGGNGKKGVVKGERLVLVKTNIRGWFHRIIGGSLRLAPAL